MPRTHRQHSLLTSGGVPSFIGGLVVFVSAAFNAQAETWFDPAFFKDDPSMVADLSRFERGQKITPGVYRVDIVLNQTMVDTRNVNFVEITPEKGIAACLTTESLDAMGVNTDAFPAFKQLDKQACAPLAEIIPDASVTFDVNKLRLEISVPQIAIKSNARGYVPLNAGMKGSTHYYWDILLAGPTVFIAVQIVIPQIAIFEFKQWREFRSVAIAQ